jgi:hypothetical protein
LRLEFRRALPFTTGTHGERTMDLKALRGWLALGAGIAVLLTSCAGSPTSHVLTGKARAPIDPAQVKIYASPPAKYEEIAIIDASSSGSGASTEQARTDAMIQRMREEAAKLGANGVIVQRTGHQGGGGSGVGVGIGGAIGGSSSIGLSLFSSDRPNTGHGVAIYVAPTGASDANDSSVHRPAQ